MSGKTERTSFSRDVARRTALLTVGRFVSKLLVFFMVRLYTACLSPAEYSAADLIVDMANLLIPLASLGVSEGIFRNAANRNRDKEAYLTAGLAVLGAGSLAFLLLSPLLTCIPLFTGTAWLIVLYVLLANLHAVVSQYLFAVGRVRLFAGQGVLNTVLIIVLNILFLPVLKLGVTGYVMSTFIADGLTTLLLILYTRLWRSVRRMSLRELWATAKPMLCFCLPLVPATLCWWITSVSDRYMIAYFLGTEANGLYAVACKIPTVLTLLSTIFLEAWQFSAIEEATGDREVHIRFYGQVWSAFLSAMVMAGSVLIVLCRVEIRLLSAARYFEAWKYVPVLSIAMVFSAFASFMGSVYVVTEKSRLSFRTTLWGALANILLNLLLIPRIGIQGAAIATLASYVLCFSIRAVSARKLIPFPLRFTRLVFSAALLGIQSLLCFVNSPIQPIGQIVALLLLLVVNRKPFVQTVQQLLHLVKRRR